MERCIRGSDRLYKKKLRKIKRCKNHLFVAKITEKVFLRCLNFRNLLFTKLSDHKMAVIIKDNSSLMGWQVGLPSGRFDQVPFAWSVTAVHFWLLKITIRIWQYLTWCKYSTSLNKVCVFRSDPSTAIIIKLPPKRIEKHSIPGKLFYREKTSPIPAIANLPPYRFWFDSYEIVRCYMAKVLYLINIFNFIHHVRLSKIKRDCPRKVPFVMICYLPTAFKVTLLHRFESSLKTDDDMLFAHRFQGNITS